MALEQKDRKLGGHVEVDVAYIGGHIRPENRNEDRRDRRLAMHQAGKRRGVMVMRERADLPHAAITEDQVVPFIRRSVATAPRSTPTNRPHGMRCTPSTTPSGSTTASPSR